ncbi:MAG: YkuS family protein [Clostridiales bacterium]|nr:YkuS family protein [Clostridiales bacterium]
MKNIGVEKNLTNVIEYLTMQGYKIHEFDTSQKNSKDFIDGFDAVIVSGIDKNLMGIQNTGAKTSIIDANGLTPQDIQKQIEQRLN